MRKNRRTVGFQNTDIAPAAPHLSNDSIQSITMSQHFDLIIRGGLIADGSGGEPYVADLAVRGGRIAAVAPEAGARAAA